MVKFCIPNLLIWVPSISILFHLSLGFDPVDNYLIDSGSSTNTTVNNRVFVADNSSSYTLSTPQNIIPRSNSDSIPSLYQTARIFTESSLYTFPIQKQGRHWIRLHFFPFVYEAFNMSKADFSVSAQNFTLFKKPQFDESPSVKEYSLNITSNQLNLSFIPTANSFAFVNAIEVFSLPENLIPKESRIIGVKEENKNLLGNALETVARVNMGNVTVEQQNDTLWRRWVSDDQYVIHNNLGVPVSRINVVNLTGSSANEDIAPVSVYGTATRLNSEWDPTLNANLTWHFNVDPGFEYLTRLHFCDIVSNSTKDSFVFNVYINSELVRHLDLLSITSSKLGVPYYMDVVTRVSNGSVFSVSVGSSTAVTQYPNAILNGLEIMKISNHKLSLDATDVVVASTSSKMRIAVIVGLVVGLFIVLLIGVALIVFCIRRRKVSTSESKSSENYAVHGGKIHTMSKNSFFTFAAVQEATNNFSESLVLGVGGFGKVYKGLLKDETIVAVKRGASQSSQGLAEFRTEIEMLSQFRHRHLVSLIGYCDEGDEMIIVYEYMEKGTLKDHLYGLDLPKLSWRQRLEICIGAARGLHYLHTGSTKAIIHRDVKSANILLDENFMAKVADFGLSKTGPEIDQTHVSTAVKGSFGYLDPEYLTRQQLTEKSDVYSFGVVLFEVLCGRTVIDPSQPREKVNMVDWAMKLRRKGKLEEIIDPCLVGEIKEESLMKFVEIAEKCLEKHGVDRPSMGDVLWNLECALQVEGSDEGKGSGSEEASSEVSLVDHSGVRNGSQELSGVSFGDLDGVSMSKVFAKMVGEEMV